MGSARHHGVRNGDLVDLELTGSAAILRSMPLNRTKRRRASGHRPVLVEGAEWSWRGNPPSADTTNACE